MSRYVVTMPQLGESVSEGIVTRWLVAPGTALAELDPMVAITTDKVEAEVPAPVSGVLREILVADGAVVPIGDPIAVLEVATVGETAADSDRTQPPPAPARPARASGELGSESGEASLAPALRKLAARHGLDLGTLAGTGPRGRVTLRDVEAAAASGTSRRGHDGEPGAGATGLEGDSTLPLSPMRRLVAERMAESKASIPHAWQSQEVDLAGVTANIAANRASFEATHGARLRYLPYVVAAAAASLVDNPMLNASFTGDHIVLHRQVNIGVAVSVADGVVVPVLRHADASTVGEIAVALARLVERARSQALTADDFAGGTFTVNNTGALGTLISYSVINPGQAGILSLGAVTDRPVAISGHVEIRPRMYLSLSLDHRVVDGLGAASFLGGCRSWLERVEPDTGLW